MNKNVQNLLITDQVSENKNDGCVRIWSKQQEMIGARKTAKFSENSVKKNVVIS